MTALPALLLAALGAAVPPPAELTVLAASSLKKPLDAASRAFEGAHPGLHIHLSAAATGVIAQQLEQGAPADVFIGAAAEPAHGLAARGVLEAPVVIARNRLVVAVPSRSALHPQALADLSSAAYRHLGIGTAKTVPAGEYAMQAIRGAHLDRALGERFVYSESVAQVLTQVTSGAVEAGFVYQSDVGGSDGAAVVAFAIDDAAHDPIVYPAAVVAKSGQLALARELVALLQGAAGQRLLTEAGFLPAHEAGLEVAGAVPNPGHLGQAELEALGAVKGTWSDHQGAHEVLGVPLDRVLARVGFEAGPMGKDVPKAEKRFGYKKVVVANSPDGFQAVFSCAELRPTMGPTRALVIWQLDGHPLPVEQGPLRLAVLTDQEPSRSLYALDRLDVVDLRQVVPPRAK